MDGHIAIKTSAKSKEAVANMLPDMQWTPILGNKAYLEWMDKETREVAEEVTPGTDLGGAAAKGVMKEVAMKKDNGVHVEDGPWNDPNFKPEL